MKLLQGIRYTCNTDYMVRYRRLFHFYFILFHIVLGTHHMDIQTWRPLGRSSYENLRRFFIGGSPELEDPTYVSVPITHDGPVLSRFGFRTETTGMVSLKLHVMQQSRFVNDLQSSKSHSCCLKEMQLAPCHQENSWPDLVDNMFQWVLSYAIVEDLINSKQDVTEPPMFVY